MVRDAPATGYVVASFQRGMVLLQGQGKSFYRLSWGETEAEADTGPDATEDDRRRAVPPGTYRVVSYRIMRRDDRGEEWFISVSGARLRKLTVEAGHTHELQIDPSITVRFRSPVRREALTIGVGIGGTPKGGLSIYHKGKRIPVRYRVVDSDGTQVAEGTLSYG